MRPVGALRRSISGRRFSDTTPPRPDGAAEAVAAHPPPPALKSKGNHPAPWIAPLAHFRRRWLEEGAV